MKVAIIQPYLFPYVGYFQLIHAVDIFVIYDDVNLITRGWIYRNRILRNGRPYLFTLPLIKSSQNKLINEMEVFENRGSKLRLLNLINDAYRTAPQYNAVMPLIENIILNEESHLSKYIEYSIIEMMAYLGIHTKIILSSEIQKNHLLRGEAKIIDIVAKVQARHYINSIGGKTLYSQEEFNKNGILLSFIETHPISYRQLSDNFCSNLSIIDVVMNNSIDVVKDFLSRYTLS